MCGTSFILCLVQDFVRTPGREWSNFYPEGAGGLSTYIIVASVITNGTFPYARHRMYLGNYPLARRRVRYWNEGKKGSSRGRILWKRLYCFLTFRALSVIVIKKRKEKNIMVTWQTECNFARLSATQGQNAEETLRNQRFSHLNHSRMWMAKTRRKGSNGDDPSIVE